MAAGKAIFRGPRPVIHPPCGGAMGGGGENHHAPQLGDIGWDQAVIGPG